MRSKCDCGAERVPMTNGETLEWPTFFCPACVDRYEPQVSMMRNKGLIWAVEPFCMPKVYRHTDPALIPCPRMRSVAETWDAWKTRSLLLHGITRLGKTRAAWEVIRRWWKVNYRMYRWVSMRDLEADIEKSFNDRQHGKYIDGLINTPLLFIDDLGKERLTQRMASDVFAIIDGRSCEMRPTIITTNFNSAALRERFDPRDVETAEAIFGRFSDYYDKFAANTEKK